MATLTCRKCGEEKTALDEAPFPNDELGDEVLAHTCADCWQEWLGMQVKLINEYGLLPVNPEHGALLEKNLKVFLKLPSGDGLSLDDVGTPP